MLAITEDVTYQSLVDKLNEKQPFSFSRWGDGEWAAVRKYLTPGSAPSRNCDKHQHFPDMGRDLLDVLKDCGQSRDEYDYLLGMQNLALRLCGEWISQITTTHNLPTAWCKADIFHHASGHNRLLPLISALRQLPVIMVGPAYLRDIDRYFGYAAFIEVPVRDCYLALSSLTMDIADKLNSLDGPVVVSLSASMPAEIILHRLYPAWKNKAWLIDFGSLWDPLVGRNTRSYHKGLDSDELRKLVLPVSGSV